jgi:hypothetical protein
MQALARVIKANRDPSSEKELKAVLGKSDASNQSLQSISDILSELDPSLDSFAYQYFLHAALAKHRDQCDALLNSMYLSQFCEFCNVSSSSSNAPIQRELIYAASRSITNACTLTRSAPHVLAAAQAICTLVSSSSRLRDTICQLHVDALQLALLGATLSPPDQAAAILTAALPIMAENILFFCEEPFSTPHKSQHIQEHVFAYFYYSGCVFCGLSKFEAAADRFFLCASAGAQGNAEARTSQDAYLGLGRDRGREHLFAPSMHEIIDAAHKKLILACLLSQNDDLSCLKHISVPRTQPYDSLVSTFSTCKDKSKASLSALRNTIARFQEVFEIDGNIELVMRLQDAYLLQAILAQSRTHVAVNALQLCSDLNLPQSVKIPDCIQALISEVFVFARLVCICFLLLAGQVEGHTPGHQTHFRARSRFLLNPSPL